VVVSNDSSFAFWYPATDTPVHAASGRAAAAAPGKPDLTATRLTRDQLRLAERYVSLLREAAGLDAGRSAGPDERPASCPPSPSSASPHRSTGCTTGPMPPTRTGTSRRPTGTCSWSPSTFRSSTTTGKSRSTPPVDGWPACYRPSPTLPASLTDQS